MKNRIYFLLLSYVAFLFLCLFFIVSYYNRLAADDFYYLGGYSEKGVWGCMRDLYVGYSARWAAYLLTGFVISLNRFKYYHFIFNACTILFLTVSVYFLIKKTIAKTLNIDLKINIAILYAIILTGNFFFTSYSISESWFWLVQVCTYLWSIIMSFLLINIFMSEKNNLLQYFILIIAALFIGGASESFALVNIFMLSAYLLFSNSNLKIVDETKILKTIFSNKKIILALVVLIISFVITMVALGNEIRYSALPKVSFLQLIWIQIKSFVKIIFIRTPLKLPLLLLFGIPWLYLGNYLAPLSAVKKNNFNRTTIYKSTLVLLCLIFIFLVPTSFIMAELGPDRALIQVSFLISFFVSAIFFVFGFYFNPNSGIFKSIKTITIGITIFVLLFQLENQFSITANYAKAFDTRTNQLIELKKINQIEILQLDPLPESGMIYSAEVAEDTSYFTNKFLKYALHLPFAIKKK